MPDSRTELRQLRPHGGPRKRGSTLSAQAHTSKRARILGESLKSAPTCDAGAGAGIPPLAEDAVPSGSKPSARSTSEKSRKLAKGRANKKKGPTQGTGKQDDAAVA